MAYDAKAIANYFLELANQQGKTIDPMAIQKLVYFAHGWNLAIFDTPLITDRIQAWAYGPVIRSLYGEFKEFGNGPITRPARSAEFKDRKVMIRIPSINDCHDSANYEVTRSILNRVWEVYGGFSAIQLSNMTHEDGSPWSIARMDNKEIIDDEVIKRYFSALTKGAEVVAERGA
jgi:uncharacterized phage-associated protein